MKTNNKNKEKYSLYKTVVFELLKSKKKWSDFLYW
jgi:hypothetical protein